MLSRVALRASRHARVMSVSRKASTLIVADHDGSAVSPGTLSTVTAASKLGGDVTVLVAGKDCAAAAESAAAVPGVAKVLMADHEAYAHAIAENITNAVAACQDALSFSHILLPASGSGKNVAPRVAAKYDVAPISEITEVVGEDVFVRPTYAGNAMARVKSADSLKIITVRGTAFDKAEATGGSASTEDAPAASSPDAGLTKFVSEELTQSDRPALEVANVVVSGGRGLKSQENFEMLDKLAEKLGGAVGASRAAVDAGYAPNDQQIGQTGKVVAPGLYLAIGISGATQHVAGMKDSKVIVAVNKDEEAPIFQLADYGLVGDLFKVVPELQEKL